MLIYITASLADEGGALDLLEAGKDQPVFRGPVRIGLHSQPRFMKPSDYGLSYE